MKTEDLENLTSVKLTFTNPNADYMAPTPLNVAEMAKFLIEGLRESGAGVVHVAQFDREGKTKFVMAIAEYQNADDNRDLLQGIKEMTHAISEGREFWVEVG